MPVHNLKFYIKKLFIGSVAVSAEQISHKLISFLLLPVFTHYLTPKDYGIISMVTFTIGILNLIYNPGIMSGAQRLYFDTEVLSERKKLLGSAFVFFLFVPLIFTLLLLFLGPYIFEHVFKELSFYPYGIFAIVIALCMQPRRLWAGFLAMTYKISKMAIFNAIAMFIGIGLSIILVVVVKIGVIGRLLGMFVSAFFLLIISTITIYRYSGKFFSYSFTELKKLFKLAYPLTFGIWAYFILDLIDRYMLERMLGIESVGIYDIGYKFAMIPLLFSLGFNKMWSPIYYESRNNKDYKTISKLISYYVMLLSFVCSSVILFSGYIFKFLINSRFSDGLSVLPWVTLGIFFMVLLTISNSSLGYDKKFSKISLIATISALTNVMLNYFLISRLGIIGAALATFISYFLYFMLGMILSKKTTLLYFNFKKILLGTSLLIPSVVIFFINPGNNYFSVSYILLKVLLIIIWIITLILAGFFSKNELNIGGGPQKLDRVLRWMI